jgi:single-strand DNA-binding protein
MINKVILVGRLGKDAIVRQTANGSSVANFSVATSESRKDEQGNWIDKTEWHNCQFWGGFGQDTNTRVNSFAERAKKGVLIYVEGKIQTRSYEQEGQTKYITEIVAIVVRVLEKRTDEQSTAAASSNSDSDLPPIENTEEDNLPF